MGTHAGSTSRLQLGRVHQTPCSEKLPDQGRGKCIATCFSGTGRMALEEALIPLVSRRGRTRREIFVRNGVRGRRSLSSGRLSARGSFFLPGTRPRTAHIVFLLHGNHLRVALPLVLGSCNVALSFHPLKVSVFPHHSRMDVPTRVDREFPGVQ